MSPFQKISATGAPLPAAATDHAAVIDNRTNLMWSAHDATDKRLTFADAGQACGALELASFSDWRLPTIEELFLLADRSKFDPAIDTDYFPGAGGWYWSSTVDASSPSDVAWLVDFDNGDADCNYQYNQGRVRAVRSVSPAASGQ